MAAAEGRMLRHLRGVRMAHRGAREQRLPMVCPTTPTARATSATSTAPSCCRQESPKMPTQVLRRVSNLEKKKLSEHLATAHDGIPLPDALHLCGAVSLGHEDCAYGAPTPRSLASHRIHCMTWKAQHAGDAAPPESPPNTGNAQETLEHVLFECRCPEIVTLRAEYANTFSAPTTNEWLESPHSAKFVYVALRVIEDRKKVAAGAAAAFTPVPIPKTDP